VVAGPARPRFLEKGQGAFVAYLVEGPDGAVSLLEAVIFGVHVCHQCLDSVAWVLAHCFGTNLFDARPDRKANAQEREEEKDKTDQYPVTEHSLDSGKSAAAFGFIWLFHNGY